MTYESKKKKAKESEYENAIGQHKPRVKEYAKDSVEQCSHHHGRAKSVAGARSPVLYPVNGGRCNGVRVGRRLHSGSICTDDLGNEVLVGGVRVPRRQPFSDLLLTAQSLAIAIAVRRGESAPTN